MNENILADNSKPLGVSPEYHDLIEDIFDFCKAAKRIPDQSSAEGVYAQMWEGKVFHDFILRSMDLRDDLKTAYEEQMDITFQTFYVSDSSGIKPKNAEKIFYLAASVYDRSPTEFLRDFIRYCDGIENFEHRAFKKHEQTLEKLLEGDQVEQEPQSILSVQDHLSVTKEIDRIKENLGLYPYGKDKLGQRDEAKANLAVRELNRLLVAVPGHVRLLALKTSLLVVLDRLDEAFEISEKLYANENQSVDVSIAHMGVLVKLGRKEEALDIAEKALLSEEGKRSPVLAYNTGVCLAYLNKDRRALEELNRAIELDKAFLRAYLALAVTYRKLWQNEKSEIVLRKALRIAPDEPQLVLMLVGVLESQDKDEEANTLRKTVDMRDFSDEKTAYLKALEAQKDNNFTQSIEIMTEFVEQQALDEFASEKQRAESLAKLANLYEIEFFQRKNREHYRYAKHYYEKSLRLFPESTNVLFKCALFCLDDGELEESREYLDKLFKLDNFDYRYFKYPEKAYISLGVAARSSFPDIDYRIPFDWCFEISPNCLACLEMLLNLFLIDNKNREAKELVNQRLPFFNDDDVDESALSSLKRIRLLGNVLNTIDEKSIEQRICTEEILKVLRLEASEENKAKDRATWLANVHSMCECLQQIGEKNKDKALLQEALEYLQILLDEALPHKDIDYWRSINFGISAIYTSLWRITNDVSFLEKDVERCNRIYRELDPKTDFETRKLCAVHLAPRYLELWHGRESREHLNEAVTLFGQVIDKHNQEGAENDLDAGFYLKAGEAYSELDRLEPDTQHLLLAEKYYQRAENAEQEETLFDAKHSLAVTLQELGFRTHDTAFLMRALDYVAHILKNINKRKHPYEWAYNSAWIGEIKYRIGVYNNDQNMYLESAKAYKDALVLSKKADVPDLDYVFWSHGQGLSLLVYCKNEEKYKQKMIREAVECFQTALSIFEPNEFPLEHASTKESLGEAYLLQGQHNGDLKLKRSGLDLLQESYAVFEEHSLAQNAPDLKEKIENLSAELGA